jgi:hypothetical protein
MVSERFLVTDPTSGRQASVALAGLVLDGDPEICRRLLPFLREPVLALRGARDAGTGARATVLQQLAVGTGPWLQECLSRAATSLGLVLSPDLP